MTPIRLLHSQVATQKRIHQARRILEGFGFAVENDPAVPCTNVAMLGFSASTIGSDVAREGRAALEGGSNLYMINVKARDLLPIYDWNSEQNPFFAYTPRNTFDRERQEIEVLREDGALDPGMDALPVKAHAALFEALASKNEKDLRAALAMHCDWTQPCRVLGESWVQFMVRTGGTWDVDTAVFVSALLEEGVSPNGVNEKGETPLMIACQRRDSLTVEALLRHGADPNAQDEDGWTPLMRLSLLCKNFKGSTVVPYVKSMEETSCIEIGQKLLDAGADPNKVPEGSSNTPLRLAAGKGMVEFCRLLAARGARIDVRNSARLRPSGTARKEGHTECAEMLEEMERILDAHTDLQVETAQTFNTARRSRL